MTSAIGRRRIGSPADAPLLADAPDSRLLPYHFRRAYGRAPVGIWRAPGSALPVLDAVGDGLAVATRYTTALAAAPRQDEVCEIRVTGRRDTAVTLPIDALRPRLGGLGDPAPGVPAWAAEAIAVAGAFQLAGHAVRGMSLLLSPGIPAGAGLGSSAAAACAAALAFRHLCAPGLPDSDLLDLAMRGACGAAPLCAPTTSDLALRCAVAFEAQPGKAVHRSGGSHTLIPLDLAGAGWRLVAVDLGLRRPAERLGRPRAFPRAPGAAKLSESVGRTGPAGLAGPMGTAPDDRDPCRPRQMILRAALDAGAAAARAVPDPIGWPALLLARRENLPAIRVAANAVSQKGNVRLAPSYMTIVPAGPGVRS